MFTCRISQLSLFPLFIFMLFQKWKWRLYCKSTIPQLKMFKRIVYKRKKSINWNLFFKRERERSCHCPFFPPCLYSISPFSRLLVFSFTHFLNYLSFMSVPWGHPLKYMTIGISWWTYGCPLSRVFIRFCKMIDIVISQNRKRELYGIRIDI